MSGTKLQEKVLNVQLFDKPYNHLIYYPFVPSSPSWALKSKKSQHSRREVFVVDVVILTIGEEVLAGDTTNTNASWLAEQVTSRGCSVRRILTIPDEKELISQIVGRWSRQFDAVIVTGGLGGTHDDVTLEAVGNVFDRDTVIDEIALEEAKAHVKEYRSKHPEQFEQFDVNIDYEDWASVPEDSKMLLNPVGLTPGWVLENVYAFPGVPSEMKAIFELVAEDFDGLLHSTVLLTDQPEGSMTEELSEVQEQFDVAVGSYPSTTSHNQIKLTGSNSRSVREASDYLKEILEIVEIIE